VAAVLRLFRLGSQSLWVDEVFSWMSADIGKPWSLAHLLENVHGPAYSLLLHVWGGIAGDSEWALRLPSAILGVALVGGIAVPRLVRAGSPELHAAHARRVRQLGAAHPAG
jgi:uncharacterized membrane protein